MIHVQRPIKTGYSCYIATCCHRVVCPAKVINQLTFHGYFSLSSPILPFFYFTKTRVGSFPWPRVAEDSHATAPSVRAEVRETAGVLVLLSINQVGYNKLSQISPMQL